jgi:hypothetical protein
MYDSEMHRRKAATLYELETGFREEGWSSEEFVYDAEHDLYRFPDGVSPSRWDGSLTGSMCVGSLLRCSKKAPSGLALRLRPA